MLMRLQVNKRAWYLDRFGVERECAVIFVDGELVAVWDLNAQPLDVPREDLYFVPEHATDE